jgi:uncharacterized protein
MRERSICWAESGHPGLEFATIQLELDRLFAHGVAIRTAPEPFRLEYQLATGRGFVTEEVVVAVVGYGWRRSLELQRTAARVWSAHTTQSGAADLPEAGGEVADLGGALDADLELSPVFNTMPVLRHHIHEREGVTEEFLMAWISVPALTIHPSRQRYSHSAVHGRDERVVRFEALGTDFAEDVTFDDDGLVVDYPHVGARVVSAEVSLPAGPALGEEAER